MSTVKTLETILDRASGVGFENEERVYTRRDLMTAAESIDNPKVEPDETTAAAVRQHIAQYGMFQDGDSVTDSRGRTWQMRGTRLVLIG